MHILPGMSKNCEDNCFIKPFPSNETQCDYLSRSLVQIMLVCGLEDEKVEDIIETTAEILMDYDMVPTCNAMRPKLRDRKEIVAKLMECNGLKTGAAHFTYEIIKYGFLIWVCGEKPIPQAARHLAKLYAMRKGLTDKQQKHIENTISVIYSKFCDTMARLRRKPACLGMPLCQKCLEKYAVAPAKILRGRTYFMQREKALAVPPIKKPFCHKAEKRVIDSKAGCLNEHMFRDFLKRNRSRKRRESRSARNFPITFKLPRRSATKAKANAKPVARVTYQLPEPKEFHTSKSIEKTTEVFKRNKTLKKTHERVVRLCDEGKQQEDVKIVITATAAGQPYRTKIRQTVVYRPKQSEVRSPATAKPKRKQRRVVFISPIEENERDMTQRIAFKAIPKVTRYEEPNTTVEESQERKAEFMGEMHKVNVETAHSDDTLAEPRARARSVAPVPVPPKRRIKRRIHGGPVPKRAHIDYIGSGFLTRNVPERRSLTEEELETLRQMDPGHFWI